MGAKDQVSHVAVDPYAGRIVKHTRIGVWDWYEEKDPDGGQRFLPSQWMKKCSDIAQSFPYVVRAVKDLLSIPGCKIQFGIYVAASLGCALIPAATIWSQTHLLQVMNEISETSVVDAQQLFQAFAARVACTVATTLLGKIREHASQVLDRRIRRWHARKFFEARARLDLPTFALKTSQTHLSMLSQSHHSAIWQSLQMAIMIFPNGVQLGAQTMALLNILRGHNEDRLLMWMTFAVESFGLLIPLVNVTTPGYACAVTTKNSDYIKMKGWERVVDNVKHRKELVAGNLAEHAIAEYTKAADKVGDNDTGSWMDVHHQRFANTSIRQHFVTWTIVHLPEFVFTLRAVQNPARLPEFMARLHLLQTSAKGVAFSTFAVLNSSQLIENSLNNIRRGYEAGTIPNIVKDGTVPFRVDSSAATSGVALEFRNVSFKYPDATGFALRNISFSLLPGQLCVIVGSNGAGKSTILKLAVRLYDPDEGEILLGGKDIRTLKLGDVREAMSVLFQDYTHFPLSIRDNIALGDPSKADNETHIREAARLGGAESLIEKLPEGFDTHLTPSVHESIQGPEEGNKTRSGKPFDVCAVRHAAGIKKSTISELSGGQMQRLAVARTFMRSVVAEDTNVGLLMFDEPSASLDPAAEHDLFDRLRMLRGNKTMIFSSHRFGNLTRHADLILYMNESSVVESGTHEELLKSEGEYARLWQMQAQAFIS